jgi:quercetin 2,3-dioxygenase
MITKRPSSERGHFNHGWLDTYHTFSFGEYHDPDHVNFRALRVINEDFVKPGMGFGMHPHRDMEIITWVLEGELQHKDSMGNGSVIRPGDLQHMSAGTGILHSEFNPSRSDPVHLLQIWLTPDKAGHTPGYAQKNVSEADRRNRLALLVSGDGRDDSIAMHQNASLYIGDLEKGRSVKHDFASGHHGFVQVSRGEVDVNGTRLSHGDSAAISAEPSVTITANAPSQVLVFDLE